MKNTLEKKSPNAVIDGIWRQIDNVARRPLLAGITVAAVAFLGNLIFSLLNGFFVPQCHDEFSFLLAGEMFAKGHLSYPAHPFWEHFVSFHMLSTPRYASGYGPVQGLFLALGFLAGLPILGNWIAAALMCAAVYWALRGWMNSRWAFIGGLFCTFQLGIYTYWSQRFWGGTPAALGGALVLGAAVRLDRKPTAVSGFLFALGLAILANSRPFEGLFAAAAGGMIILSGISDKRVSLGEIFKKAALPFLITVGIAAVLTGIYNKDLTGSPFVLPQSFMARSESRAGFFIWQSAGPPRVYLHQVMKDFEEGFALHYFLMHKTLSGFLEAKFEALCNFFKFYAGPLYSILILITLPQLWKYKWPRFMLFAIGGYFVLGVLPLAVKPQEHYIAPFVVFITALVVYGLRCFMNLKCKSFKLGKCLALIFLLCALVPREPALIMYPYINSYAEERADFLKSLKERGGRHLILVKYEGTFNFQHFEWVYNGADIDAQDVVWARSMDDARDQKLIEYYKDRNIWLMTVDGSGRPYLKAIKVSPDFTFYVAPF